MCSLFVILEPEPAVVIYFTYVITIVISFLFHEEKHVEDSV